jgi:hypothetical protein
MNNLDTAYDTLVGISLVNLYTLSKDSQSINFGNFDINNEEHLYLLKVAITSYSVLQKSIRFNLPYWKRRKIAKMLDYPEVVEWKKRAKKFECFNTSEVLDFMRPAGALETGDELFMFSDIYHRYYEKSEKND